MLLAIGTCTRVYFERSARGPGVSKDPSPHSDGSCRNRQVCDLHSGPTAKGLTVFLQCKPSLLAKASLTAARSDLVAVGKKRTWIARGPADGHPLRRVGRFALSSIEGSYPSLTGSPPQATDSQGVTRAYRRYTPLGCVNINWLLERKKIRQHEEGERGSKETKLWPLGLSAINWKTARYATAI
jgi:hypothetical protein